MQMPFANTLDKLPPALFTVGTEDPLLDDSVLMSAKWAMSGAESILKVYPGAPHGFIYFPPAASETVKQGTDDIITFLTEKRMREQDASLLTREVAACRIYANRSCDVENVSSLP